MHEPVERKAEVRADFFATEISMDASEVEETGLLAELMASCSVRKSLKLRFRRPGPSHQLSVALSDFADLPIQLVVVSVVMLFAFAESAL